MSTENNGPMIHIGPPAPDGNRLATCPSCGLRAIIDREQYQGKVSIDCPECEYHETHDHR